MLLIFSIIGMIELVA
jgi:hypothetical protein